MKISLRVFAVVAALILVVPFVASAQNSQSYHAGSLLLDDGSGHSIIINPPSTGAGLQTFTFPTGGGTVATTNYVLSQIGNFLPVSGGTMTGAINGLQAGTTLGSGTPVAGGVYKDNQILASGFVEGNALSVVTGNVTLIHVSAGLYELDFAVPVTGIQHPLTVTPDACCNADAPSTATVQWISLSPLQYYVRTYGFNSTSHVFTQEDYNFTFILVP